MIQLSRQNMPRLRKKELLTILRPATTPKMPPRMAKSRRSPQHHRHLSRIILPTSRGKIPESSRRKNHAITTNHLPRAMHRRHRIHRMPPIRLILTLMAFTVLPLGALMVHRLHMSIPTNIHMHMHIHLRNNTHTSLNPIPTIRPSTATDGHIRINNHRHHHPPWEVFNQRIITVITRDINLIHLTRHRRSLRIILIPAYPRVHPMEVIIAGIILMPLILLRMTGMLMPVQVPVPCPHPMVIHRVPTTTPTSKTPRPETAAMHPPPAMEGRKDFVPRLSLRLWHRREVLWKNLAMMLPLLLALLLPRVVVVAAAKIAKIEEM
mmetsp:Transcript_13939/g.29130  ORF Transcript_13939/g.29130 Transcript_13939/m.29130 type:complete len:322 (-) Transcript_13939:1017-1982(-)